MSKQDKRKFNKQYLFEYFSTNVLTRKHYREAFKHDKTMSRNVLLFWEEIEKEDNEKCLFN